jgi:PKD repeat protein
VQTLAPVNDENFIKLNGKHLGLFFILFISFFGLVSYVRALTSFQPTFVSKYGGSVTAFPPIADAGPDQDVYIYDVVFFDGSGSKNPYGQITSYSWDFGDGARASGKKVSHSYTSVGVFTVKITVKDNFQLTDTDTLIITVSMPTIEEIGGLPINETIKFLKLMSLEDSLELLMNLNSSDAVDLFGELNVSLAQNIVNTAARSNYTTEMSAILLGVEKELAAEIIIGLGEEIGVKFVESLMGINATGCAYIVESAISLDLVNLTKLLEMVDDELLAELLLEIAGLPSTPQTVAIIFESLSIDKSLAVIKKWLAFNELQELGESFGYLNQETMNNIFDLLSINERKILYPYLSTSTVSLIGTKLLPLPDLRLMSITVSRMDSRGYNVSVVIQNHGNVDTGRFLGEFRIEDVRKESFEVLDLSADSSTEVSYMWTPTSMGINALEVLLDTENLIEELDETNNRIFTSYGVRLPELLVSFETVPTELVEGNTYVLEVLVSNTGEEEAENFVLLTQASGIIIEQGEVRWISQTIDSTEMDILLAGESRVIDVSWAPENSGAYTLKAIVDSNEQVLEADKMNNEVTLQIEIVKKTASGFNIIVILIILAAGSGIFYYYRSQIISFAKKYIRPPVTE